MLQYQETFSSTIFIESQNVNPQLINIINVRKGFKECRTWKAASKNDKGTPMGVYRSPQVYFDECKHGKEQYIIVKNKRVKIKTGYHLTESLQTFFCQYVRRYFQFQNDGEKIVMIKKLRIEEREKEKRLRGKRKTRKEMKKKGKAC